ncbi:DUF397 domain-containing protein [Streptomyces samsunensis]|uniref:DUF397 domain-containing protein n=4 Tax=Streptomyces TaxID=1883 RepID=A0A291SU70_STRMQ|nr:MULTISPECIES: DUF397 domain-containing protein [Streptomyces]MYU10349.1 DUF397 domain-containing protein [Streptomyces sp. SID8361]AQA13167.1 DUF397 domain-containing protein [Streptomyces autolyticus]ATL84434.1 hypothetical protein SMALA_4201 [Streptomyces malaysiensis]AUA12281.1 hypothetical protein CFP59_04410 [Streptomyces sp. M56]MCC4319995.1 DUF397 domain-containing protein [Streptomyces malaysiensis]
MTRRDWRELDWQRAAPDDIEEGSAYLEVAVGPDDQILMRESNDPETVVVTTRAKWEAFLKGVKAGEFDDFADLTESDDPAGK